MSWLTTKVVNREEMPKNIMESTRPTGPSSRIGLREYISAALPQANVSIASDRKKTLSWRSWSDPNYLEVLWIIYM